MRSIHFTIGKPPPNGLDDDTRLRQLEIALQEKFEVLRGKTLSAELSWWPFELPDGTRYSLWMKWKPEESITVHYRVLFNFEDESHPFFFGDISVQIEVDALAERRSLLCSLLRLELVQPGKESIEPEKTLRYATSPVGERSLIPLSHDGEKLELAFYAPEALSSSFHPLLPDAQKAYFWVDKLTLLTLAEQLWGSSEPFPDETLWLTEEISSIQEVPGVQKFPSSGREPPGVWSGGVLRFIGS